jgi:two-component system sensor histidine kinase TctE
VSLRRLSLKYRLVLMLVVPLLLLGFLFLSQAYSTAQDTSDRVYDRVLLGSALAISERIVVGEQGNLEVDLPYVALEMLTSAAQDRVYYRVVNASKTVTGYGELPKPPDSINLQAGQSLFYDAAFRGADVRVVALAGAASGRRASIPLTVFVAETTQARQRLVRETIVASAWRTTITILAALAIVWIGISWGLRPLQRLQEALARRSSTDLRPIEHPVPDEVVPIVQEINELLRRLENTLRSTRTFTGNASHQLRTPLAVAKANLELVSRDEEGSEFQEAIAAAHDATTECQRLVERLLLLAQIDGQEFDLQSAPMLDITEIAISVTRELAPQAVQQGHELEFIADNGVARIRGEPLLLSEAIKNLIENAIKHCPRGSQISVRCALAAGKASIAVDDNGPGIPLDLRRQALERFGRLNGDSNSGSGLGLSIANEIALRHGGSLELSRSGSGGLSARLDLSAIGKPE